MKWENFLKTLFRCPSWGKKSHGGQQTQQRLVRSRGEHCMVDLDVWVLQVIFCTLLWNLILTALCFWMANQFHRDFGILVIIAYIVGNWAFKHSVMLGWYWFSTKGEVSRLAHLNAHLKLLFPSVFLRSMHSYFLKTHENNNCKLSQTLLGSR